MPNRASGWFAQADRDPEQARASRADGRHEWACFAAQQSAEKAVKALHLWLGQEAWGHVVARLLSELPVDAGDLGDKGKVLAAIVAAADDAVERRAAEWDLGTLPVPAEILVYTTDEWARLPAAGGRFARQLAREVRWLVPDANGRDGVP